MRISVLGGGPSGLHFATLMKQSDQTHCIRVYERSLPARTYGFGVVLSGKGLAALEAAAPRVHRAIGRHLVRWEGMDIHLRGTLLHADGFGFGAVDRTVMLRILTEEALRSGVDISFGVSAPNAADLQDDDLIVAADGARSFTRARSADSFGTHEEEGACPYIWLGLDCPVPRFSFVFLETQHGLFRVHSYPHSRSLSTAIVETDTGTWQRAGLADADDSILPRGPDSSTLGFCQQLLAEPFGAARILHNESRWRRFVTVTNERWHHGNVVLLGDAAHTQHFSVGSGTQLAMDDAAALARCLDGAESSTLPAALKAYEEERRPLVERTQQAAQASAEWFEDAERYIGEEPLQFGFSLLTRSRRVTHNAVMRHSPLLCTAADAQFARRAAASAGLPRPHGAGRAVPSPLDTPLRLRHLVLPSRGVLSASVFGTSAADALRTIAGSAAPVFDHIALVIATVDLNSRSGQDSSRQLGEWQPVVELLRASGIAAGVRLTGTGTSDSAAQSAAAAADAGFDMVILGAACARSTAGRRSVPASAALLAAVTAARTTWPSERPLAASLPHHGSRPDTNGLAVRAQALALRLAGAGCDLLDVQNAQPRIANAVRLGTQMPTLVSPASSGTDADTALLAGHADLCMMPPLHLPGEPAPLQAPDPGRRDE